MLNHKFREELWIFFQLWTAYHDKNDFWCRAVFYKQIKVWTRDYNAHRNCHYVLWNPLHEQKEAPRYDASQVQKFFKEEKLLKQIKQKEVQLQVEVKVYIWDFCLIVCMELLDIMVLLLESTA